MEDTFARAVALLDDGDAAGLARLLDEHPDLVRERTDFGSEAYFRRPYLLWFAAGNPVRNERLPANIASIARLLIDRGADQIDYTLELVCSGRVPRECRVQHELIDVLCDAGADPDAAMRTALAHKELDAVERLLERGARTTLVVAACLGRPIEPFFDGSTEATRHEALTAAAFYGHAPAVAALLAAGVDVNAFSPAGFHAHATPLHHAVDSGSLDCVRVLVDGGARLDIEDSAYCATPLGWAEYLGRPAIAAFLRSRAETR
jgi:ankyrin repeat protein